MTIQQAQELMKFRQYQELSFDEFEDLEESKVDEIFQEEYSDEYELTQEQFYYSRIDFYSQLILQYESISIKS